MSDNLIALQAAVVADQVNPPPEDKTKDDDLLAVHKEAMRRHDEAWVFEVDNVNAGREDQRFYAGGIGQWDPAAIKARGTHRPMLTINRLPTFVRQLTGDIRQNTPAIKVMPAKGPASKEIAEILNGIIRSIEAQSDADACYVIAADNAAQAGQGAFRIITKYSSDTGFEQDLRIEPIRDPFGVLIDPMAKLPDKSDMEFAFIYERYAKEVFTAKWPKASADDIPNNAAAATTGTGFNWRTGDSVRVAEYWCKKPEKKTIYELPDGSVVEELPKGMEAVREREVATNRVVSYMISGSEVLSGPHEWAGKYIPIGFVVGEEITIDGATSRKGMVRDAKDPQRLYNYARTAAAESIALQPKAPFVATVEEIKGYEHLWQTAGSENHSVLIYNRDKNSPLAKPERSQPAMGQQGLDSQALLSASDMEAVTGIFKANLGAPSNETSGRAILSRQKEGDTGTFLYVDNLRRALAYAGRCLLDLIPKVYDTERIVRVLKEDGTHEMATVNQQVQDGEDPAIFKVLNDLSIGEYDVVVSTGPSFLTRRAETASMLIDLAGKMPIVGEKAPDLLFKALDVPGGDEVADRLVPPEHRKDKDGNPINVPPPPQLVAAVKKEMADAEKATAEAEGQQIENIGALMTLMTTLQGIPQTIEAMKMKIDELVGAQQQQQPATPPGGAPPAAPPPQPLGLPQPNAGPPQAEGDGEIVDMHEGAPV